MIETTRKTCTSDGSRIQFEPDLTFDRHKMRHFLEGNTNVMHCHHYTTLFTQLAMDARNFNGPTLLVQAAADAFFKILSDYMNNHQVTDFCDRIAVVEQYYAFVGLGSIRFECSPNTATVTMAHSHVDEGWLRRYGMRDERVNYIGEGFLKAACAVVHNQSNPHAIHVSEVESIVTGDKQSKFVAEWE